MHNYLISKYFFPLGEQLQLPSKTEDICCMSKIHGKSTSVENSQIYTKTVSGNVPVSKWEAPDQTCHEARKGGSEASAAVYLTLPWILHHEVGRKRNYCTPARLGNNPVAEPKLKL